MVARQWIRLRQELTARDGFFDKGFESPRPVAKGICFTILSLPRPVSNRQISELLSGEFVGELSAVQWVRRESVPSEVMRCAIACLKGFSACNLVHTHFAGTLSKCSRFRRLLAGCSVDPLRKVLPCSTDHLVRFASLSGIDRI
jgi:hypothetical protein